MNRLRCLVALASTLSLSTVAQAHNPVASMPPEAPRFVLSAAFSQGGDDLASVESDDGYDDDLEAGGGLYLGVGIEFPFTASNLALRTTVGYQADSVEADNGEAEFEKLPWEGLLLMSAGAHRFGVGLTYHTDIEYTFEDDFGRDIDAEFDDATGVVLAYEYAVSPQFGLSLRYTDIEYDVKTESVDRDRAPVDGSNVGVGINFLF